VVSDAPTLVAPLVPLKIRGIEVPRRLRRSSEVDHFCSRKGTQTWRARFVVRPGHVSLGDHFLSRTLFQWQSKNCARRDDPPPCRLISGHKAQGIPVHLFVRNASKIPGGASAPFVYCGDVEFVDWDREKPITIRWQAC
jgi:hypothetical protein